MTEGVTASISVRVQANLSSPPPVGQATQEVNQSFALSLLAGTGVGNSDTLFTKALNIGASGNVSLDLAGSLDDAFGGVVTFADVQAVFLEADATNVNDIIVGGAASDPWVGPFNAGTDTVGVHPGGVLLWADPAGWPVVGSTGDLLKITNGGGGSAVTGKLILIGRSA